MAQELGEQAREHTQRIIVEQRREHDVRGLTSQTGLNPTLIEQMQPEQPTVPPREQRFFDNVTPLGGKGPDDDDDQSDHLLPHPEAVEQLEC